MPQLWEIPGHPRGEGPQARVVISYALTVLILLGGISWLTSRLVYFRDPPIDFHQLEADDLLVVSGMNRRQGVSLKVGFLEQFEPPRVGLFGNHQFQYLTRDAFGDVGDDYFFNYWFANLSLAELRGYLHHAAALGKLPRETILVMITSPNADNGNYIITYNGELFPDMHANAQYLADPWRIPETLEAILDSWYAQLYYRLSYSSLYSSLVMADENAAQIIESRLLSRARCERLMESGGEVAEQAPLTDWMPTWLVSIIPSTLRPLFTAHRQRNAVACNRYHLSTALQRDGATLEEFNTAPLRLNWNTLERDHLSVGDDARIARYMRDIMELGEQEGRRVVFVIPPVFETERQSSADEIFDRALARVPDAEVLDHRNRRDRQGYFITYEHPSSAYFDEMVRELRVRRLIP